MKLQPHISVVGVSDAGPLRDAAARHASALARFGEQIVECRVTVGLWHRHQEPDRLFRVQVEVDLPHTAVHLTREAANDASTDDVDELMRSALDAVGRQIEAALSQAGEPGTKLSPEQRRLRPLHGRVE